VTKLDKNDIAAYQELFASPLDQDDPDDKIWELLCKVEAQLLEDGYVLRDIRPAKVSCFT